MARFLNTTGSVLNSAEFGPLPPGEFTLDGYDPDVHGVIPGCTRLDAPPPGPAPAAAPDGPGEPKPGRPAARKTGDSAQDKEPAA